MQLIRRLQRTIGKRRYMLLSTERLIHMVAEQSSATKAGIMIEALKERLAHQDGSLDQVDWASANLTGALLSSSRMQHAKFRSALLRGAYFGYSDLSGCDFSLADLREAHFREARLNDARFDGANLSGANFARAILSGGTFVAADLSRANFWRADLRGADLTDASMHACNLADVIVDESTTLPNGQPCADGFRWERFTKGAHLSRHSVFQQSRVE